MICIERVVETKDYLTKSNLPASDYVINPYVGCPHACKYCYACFMKRFTNHKEEWGSFIDIKKCDKPINLKKIEGKTVFLSSVTDCYNPYEEKYELTRNILKQLLHANCELSISTKSKLILRDIELLKKFPHLKVSISMNTINEAFRSAMDHGSTIAERMQTMKELHNAGIYTILFMSPIFPYITEWKAIIEEVKDYVNEFWFENLNLRGSYKKTILDYIEINYPQYVEGYNQIYRKNQKAYWEQLSLEIDTFCKAQNVKFINYFYHEQLVKAKLENKNL